ncbi:MAG: hypothetical protein ACP5O0_09940 [Acidimicrobiales bacterium]
MTFKDLIDAWKLSGSLDLSPKTVSNYESICRRYISDSIGKKKVARSEAYDLETYFRTFADKGLGVSGVRQVRAILQKAAKLGRRWSNGTFPYPVADSDLPLSLARP